MEGPLPSILVVGSANVDMIVRSERLPRPGETVVGGEFISAGGGKGANQAIAARRLGATVSFVGRVGDDGPGRFTLDALRSEGIDVRDVAIDPEAATGVALILVDRDGQNVISVASGANQRVTPEDVRAASDAFDRADIFVGQLEIPLDAVETAFAMARERGIPTVLNPAPARPVPDSLIRLVDWLTPNEFEASTLTGLPVVDAATARVAADALIGRGARGVVVTLGDRGAVLRTADRFIAVAARAVKAIDATAAGDAFTGAFAVALGRGDDASSALAYANVVGALATTRSGAQPSLPIHTDVARFLREHGSAND